MNEMVFFNPADSIGNFHDHNEAVQSAQIYKEKKQQPDQSILVVKSPNHPDFEVFLADDVISSDQANQSHESYQLSDRI